MIQQAPSRCFYLPGTVQPVFGSRDREPDDAGCDHQRWNRLAISFRAMRPVKAKAAAA
jgi:hypothetical protein